MSSSNKLDLSARKKTKGTGDERGPAVERPNESPQANAERATVKCEPEEEIDNYGEDATEIHNNDMVAPGSDSQPRRAPPARFATARSAPTAMHTPGTYASREGYLDHSPYYAFPEALFRAEPSQGWTAGSQYMVAPGARGIPPVGTLLPQYRSVQPHLVTTPTPATYSYRPGYQDGTSLYAPETIPQQNLVAPGARGIPLVSTLLPRQRYVRTHLVTPSTPAAPPCRPGCQHCTSLYAPETLPQVKVEPNQGLTTEGHNVVTPGVGPVRHPHQWFRSQRPTTPYDHTSTADRCYYVDGGTMNVYTSTPKRLCKICNPELGVPRWYTHSTYFVHSDFDLKGQTQADV